MSAIQSWIERDDARDLGRLRSAHLLDRADFVRRMNAVLRDADEIAAAAEVEHELGQARAQRDDAHALDVRPRALPRQA